MAGGGTGEHDDADRAFFAGMLIVLALLFTGLALAHRTHLTHSSRPGDACPVTANGGIIGLDAKTGAVRWKNIVPVGTVVRQDTDPDPDEIEAVTAVETDDPGITRVVERTIDARKGRVTTCAARLSSKEVAAVNQSLDGGNPLDPPAKVGDATIVPWGDGLRATDPTNTGIWGREHSQARARIGDDLIVSTTDGEQIGAARISLATGEERWAVDEAFIATADDRATVITADPQDPESITARDAATGAVRWTSHLPWPDTSSDPWRQGIDAGPLVIFPAGNGGKVVAVDSRTGRIAWHGEAGSPGRDWKHSAPGSVTSAARSADGRTVVVTVDAWIPDQYD